METLSVDANPKSNNTLKSRLCLKNLFLGVWPNLLLIMCISGSSDITSTCVPPNIHIIFILAFFILNIYEGPASADFCLTINLQYVRRHTYPLVSVGSHFPFIHFSISLQV